MDPQLIQNNIQISLMLLRRPDLAHLLLLLAQPVVSQTDKASRILIRQVLINQGVDPADLPPQQDQPILNLADHLSPEEMERVRQVEADACRTPRPFFALPTTSNDPVDPPPDPIVHKTPKNKDVPTPSGFEMGHLPISTYYPTHFFKGTAMQVNNTVKRVEDLSSDDFIRCASDLTDSSLTASIVESIFLARGTATVTLLVGDAKQRNSVQVQLEHPFFVLGKGWSSCLPRKTAESYGLQCEVLQQGDICIVVTQDDGAGNELVNLAAAERRLEDANRHVKIREAMRVDIFDGRVSAPPPRILFDPIDENRCVSEPII